MDRSDFTEELEPADVQPGSSAGLVDPRSADDFDPKFYPKADGAPCPAPGAGSRDHRIKGEFCAVYYQLNRLHARLTEMRTQAEQPSRPEREREVMRGIESYLKIRDAL